MDTPATEAAQPPSPSATIPAAQLSGYLDLENRRGPGQWIRTFGEAFLVMKPNTAGGVDVWARNTVVGPTVKYIDYSVVPYNAVGDAVESEIGGKSEARLRVTGPLSAGDDSGEAGWKNVWYNATIDYIKVVGVAIDLMDGEHQEFDLSDSPITGVRRCVIQSNCSQGIS